MIGRFPIYPSLPAADIERARTWYADKLGLAPVSDNGSGILGYVSGGVSFILYRTGAAGSARNTAAGWLVDDLESLMAELRARGVAFEDYAMGRTGPTTVNGVATDRAGVRSAWFRDSEGNVLTIVQLPPGMRG